MSNSTVERQLRKAAENLVYAAKMAGATASDAVAGQSVSVGISVRNGIVENSENSENSSIAFRVFVGHRVASVSADATADPHQLAARAVAMAKASPEDDSQGLADPDLLTDDLLDLELFDSTEPGADKFREMALECEAAALSVAGVANSGGASAGYGSTGAVLVTSHGFSGAYKRSGYSVSASAIAGEGTQMERDYDFSSRTYFGDLADPASIGKNAGERAVRRLNPAKIDTGMRTIVLDPRVSRSIAGHLSGAINGIAVARKTSFLRDSLGAQIFPNGFHVTDNPLIKRRGASRPFDGEGVRGELLDVVVDGVLQCWLLSCSAARELGLKTNGRGSRSGTGVTPSSTNFAFEPGQMSPQDLINSVGNGVYITELFGQGVNMITGQYSRGASGFLIENGEITRPVSEFTVASDLASMFKRMILANDVDRNYSTAAPTMAIEGMMIAGTSV